MRWTMVVLLAGLSGLLGGLGCAAETDAASSSGSEVEVPSCDAGQEAEVCEVYQLVNEERAAAGVGPMEWNSELAVAAQLHAEDMVAQGYFDHTSLDGRSFSQRADDAGYDAFASGENIAQGQPDAATVMSSWMGSSGHRNNILSGSSNEIGVGLQDRTWVQVFGQR